MRSPRERDTIEWVNHTKLAAAIRAWLEFKHISDQIDLAAKPAVREFGRVCSLIEGASERFDPVAGLERLRKANVRRACDCGYLTGDSTGHEDWCALRGPAQPAGLSPVCNWHGKCRHNCKVGFQHRVALRDLEILRAHSRG
jgi:hypothetical protein